MRAKKIGSIRFLSFILVISLIFINGCATFSSKNSEKGSNIEGDLEVSGTLKFDDIPVPFGIKLINEESFIFQNDRVRVGLLKYKGRVTADKVVSFYRYQMPLYKWDLINIIEYGRRVLNFEKNGQSCILTIDSTMSGVVLTLAVAPRTKVSMPLENE